MNPAGQTTTYQLEYNVEGSDWCNSAGDTGSFLTTSPQTLPFTDATDHDVSAALTGLSPATDYCAAITATNGSGSSSSGTLEFSTPQAPPVVTTGLVTNLTARRQRWPAPWIRRVCRRSGTSTTARARSTVHHAARRRGPGSAGAAGRGDAGWSFSEREIPLSAGRYERDGYDERLGSALLDSEPVSRSDGHDRLGNPRDNVRGHARGTVNPNGLATAYHFEYGKTTKYESFTPNASAGAESTPKPVNAGLTGLAPNTTYHYRLVATNSAATNDGADGAFKTAGQVPSLTGVALAALRFPAKSGTELRFTLSEPAKITIAIAMPIKGHRVKGACNANAKHGKVCVLMVKGHHHIRGRLGRNDPPVQRSAAKARTPRGDDDGT